MPDATHRQKNIAPWWGLLFALGAIGCNAAFFVSPPFAGSTSLAERVVRRSGARLSRCWNAASVWPGTCLSRQSAERRADGDCSVSSRNHRVRVRQSPGVTQFNCGAKVGQRVSDFTLSVTSGRPVSLDQLLAPAGSASTSQSPPTSPRRCCDFLPRLLVSFSATSSCEVWRNDWRSSRRRAYVPSRSASTRLRCRAT